MRFILLCLLATLVPEKIVFCYLGILSSPKYWYLANSLYLIAPFFKRIGPLLSLYWVCYSHYHF